MNKRTEYAKGRDDGLALALKIVLEDGGVDALKKEIEMRHVTKISTPLAEKDLFQALIPIKEHTIDTVLALSLLTLRDEFDMGKTRLQRFADRFSLKSSCLLENLCNWQDILDTIKTETGIAVTIRNIEK